jgi:hypothetical protein
MLSKALCRANLALFHLYPRLSVGGVLIIDDYGHWEGARKAIDEYLEETRFEFSSGMSQ